MRIDPNLLRRSGIEASGFLALTDGGLQMSMSVTPEMRQNAFRLETAEKRERIENAAGGRADIQVVINPAWIELSALMAYFQARAVAHNEPNTASVLHRQDDDQLYERQWETGYSSLDSEPRQSEHAEGQQLYLVGFQDGTPIGYVKIRPEVHQFANGQVDLDLHLDMVYVSGKLRGNGYGVDLAVATSSFVKELVGYVYAGCGDTQSLQVHIAAESISERGQMFLEHVAAATKERIDALDGNSQMKGSSVRGFTCHP